MTANSPFDPKHWPKMEGFPDLLITQQRSFEAMTKAGQILGEAMRQCAERQMHAAKSAFDQLVVKAPLPAAATPEDSWREHSQKLQAQIEQLAAHIASMHEIMVEANKAALGELQSVWNLAAGSDAGAYPGKPTAAAQPAPKAAAPGPAPAEAPPRAQPKAAEPRPAKPVVVIANHDQPAEPKPPAPPASPSAIRPESGAAAPESIPTAKRAAPKAAKKPPTKL